MNKYARQQETTVDYDCPWLWMLHHITFTHFPKGWVRTSDTQRLHHLKVFQEFFKVAKQRERAFKDSIGEYLLCGLRVTVTENALN